MSDDLSDVVTAHVVGLSCASCVRRVETALRDTPGVHDAAVNLATGGATVRLGARAPSAAALRDVVRAAGFDLATETRQLAIEGLNCAACVGRVEKALRADAGVLDARVNLLSGQAEIARIAGADDLDRAIAAVRRAGFDATPIDRAASPPPADAGPRRRALWAAALTAPLFVVEMGGHLAPAFAAALDAMVGRGVVWVGQWALATLVLFGPGLGFFRSGGAALRRAAPDMNALVALGARAAWAFPTVVVLAPAPLPAPARQAPFEAAARLGPSHLAGPAPDAPPARPASPARRRVAPPAPRPALSHPH